MAAAGQLQLDPNSSLNFTTLATQTEGYLAADLEDLISRAIHQVAMNSARDPELEVRPSSTHDVLLSDRSSSELLGLWSIQSSAAGFRARITPRCQITHFGRGMERHWRCASSVFVSSDAQRTLGLRETKRVLRETLEWPTKYAQIFAQSPLRLRSGCVRVQHNIPAESLMSCLGFFFTDSLDAGRPCSRPRSPKNVA